MFQEKIKILTFKTKNIFSKIWSGNKDDREKTNTDWRSIYIATFVALISSIQSYSVIPTLWPYIKFINPGVSEIANGAFQGAQALGTTLTSFLGGYLVNRLSNTKPPLIAAKILAIIATFFYLGIELNSKAAIYLLVAYQLLMGTSLGFGNAYKTHIAMATQESERSRAFGLAMFSNSLGSIFGPLLQMLFALISYPGIPLLFGMHFNLYTACVYFTLITSIIALICIIIWFNGKLNVLSKEERQKQIEVAAAAAATELSRQPEENGDEEEKIVVVEEIKYDRVAVIVLIITKIVQDINLLILKSIVLPYAMTVFEWSSKELILYQSLLMAPMGISSLIFSFCYIRFNVDKKIPERIALLIGLGLFMLFYIATFPWWFIKETIPYAHEKNVTAFYSQSEATAALAAFNETGELVGCNVAYKWCETTARINLVVFCISVILVIGIGIPFLLINLDIIYSKILGPIKQGVLQGIFQSSGEIMNIFGPLVVTIVYTNSGPKWIWLFDIIISILCIILYLIFYKRLIPFTKRVEKKMKKRGIQATITFP